MSARDLTRQAAEKLGQGSDSSAEFTQQVTDWSHSLELTTLGGLLPIAVAMLILHEMYFATTESRAPRVGWMLLRIVGFGACLLGYDRVVGMLTGLVGGGAWPEVGDLIAPLHKAATARLSMLSDMNMGNMGVELPNFLLWLVLFMIDCMLALFAIIAITVLTKIQALLLVIFISTGKTCIVLSIMPGVGIAKSWARLVATVAAWSAMAGFVFSAVGVQSINYNMVAQSGLSWHMHIWLQYAMLGIFTISIPKLVGAVVSGGMSAAPGMGAAIGGAFMGAKFLSPPSPTNMLRRNGRPGNRQGQEKEPTNGGGGVRRSGGKQARSNSSASGSSSRSNRRTKSNGIAAMAARGGAPKKQRALTTRDRGPQRETRKWTKEGAKEEERKQKSGEGRQGASKPNEGPQQQPSQSQGSASARTHHAVERQGAERQASGSSPQKAQHAPPSSHAAQAVAQRGAAVVSNSVNAEPQASASSAQRTVVARPSAQPSSQPAEPSRSSAHPSTPSPAPSDNPPGSPPRAADSNAPAMAVHGQSARPAASEFNAHTDLDTEIERPAPRRGGKQER